MSKYMILVVDDDLNNIQLGINILKKNTNYEIIFAISGQQALERVKEYDFDLILLDIVMEPMDGYEVAKRLKADEKTQDIPIIYLTAKDDEKSILKGFDMGAVDYINKPFYENVLLARVKTHIDLKTYKDQLLEKLHIKDQLINQQAKMAMMGEMVESIAHQWRQPLSVISTASSGMQMQEEMGILNSDVILSSCASINNSTAYLSQTIDDFREFFNNDKKKNLFDIEKIFHNSMNLLISRFKNKDIEIIENITTTNINGCENELIQVFMNILNNAREELEKIESKRMIVIDIYQKNQEAIIKITDSAGGVPEDILFKIFDSYFTTKKQSDGTGIGLYMTKKIISNSFNGTITVENTNFKIDGTKYKGAQFLITLPL